MFNHTTEHTFLHLLYFFHIQNTTSGQSNLTLDRIAAADRRFNSIRQVAPMCTPYIV